MSPTTNHLVANIETVHISKRGDYEQLPAHLQREADKELAGRSETHVDPTSRSPLAKWAKKKRKQKRAIQNRSRKHNR